MRNLDLTDPLLRDGHVVVSASAGSGKTFTLTVLVCSELGIGTLRPFEILATTFSEAAASDLRARLLRPLDLLSSLDAGAWEPLLAGLGDDAAFQKALAGLPLSPRLDKSRGEVRQAARIWTPDLPWTTTPVRAAAFWRRTRREAELLRVSTLHALALSLLKQGEGAPGDILDATHPALLRLLRQAFRSSLGTGNPDPAAAKLLLRWAESHWEELSQAYDGHRDARGTLMHEDPTPFRVALDQALERALSVLAPHVSAPSSAAARTKKGELHKTFKPQHIKALPGPWLDQRLRWAEAQSSMLLNEKGLVKSHFAEALQPAETAFPAVADALEALLGCLLVDALQNFEALKTARGCATFGDLVRQALEGLLDGTLPPPRPKLLLVDEYQDTSRVQDAFLAALQAERTVRVGDLKQAIYGFRGGSPELLQEHLELAGARAYRLPANHRSSPQVVALANRYVDELWPRLDPEAKGLDGHQQAVGAGICPVGFVRTEAEGSGTELPELAPWIQALSHEAGWNTSLEPRPGPRRRALLLRQRTGLGRLLMRLKAQGVQPYVIAKEGFWESPGVRLLMAALEAVARPDQPLPAMVLLRQIAGLTDPELTALVMDAGGHLPGLRGLALGHVPPDKQDAVVFLQRLLRETTQGLAALLLAEGSLLAGLAALESQGALEPLRARRNLAGLLVRLGELPSHPATAFAILEQERLGAQKGDVPGNAEAADLLIHTAHASKGLEYDDVILPLLQSRYRGPTKGALLTDPTSRKPMLGWKLGGLKGAALQAISTLQRARARRDDLNLLYVALTRARERMVLLHRGKPEAVEPEQASHWAHFGRLLAGFHPELQLLAEPPAPLISERRVVAALMPPPSRTSLPLERPSASDSMEDAESQAKASLKGRREGEAMHAYVRDLLLRWEDPEALAAFPAPDVPNAKAKALRFLAQMETRGWRSLRRRTELPLEGAAASGALGFADLVVFAPDAIHLVDLKHSDHFGEADLTTYGAQLRRYAAVLHARHGCPVDAWLVALKSGTWVEVEV